MPRYRYVLEESALNALLALDDSAIIKLIPAFESLAEHPVDASDTFSLDRRGRPLRNRKVVDYVIGFWPDHATKTVHIIRIDFL
jgi:hypothetical protein